MGIHDMQLFSIDDVCKAWDDACTRIIPLASIHPLGRAQIREYFTDILMRRMMGDDSFPEEPQPIEVTPIERKEDS
jgi:hypothetical protein